MDSELTKRLAWSGLVAAFGAVGSMITTRLAAIAYRRIFDEDPPE